MFGFGKNNKAIDAFADELVADFVKRFPIEKEKDLGSNKAKPARNLGKAAGELVDRRSADFVFQHKLGVYGKARLLNRVKWQMQEIGYTTEFVDLTLAELTRSIARTVRPAPAK
jgi:hypothetical protein